MIKRNTKKMMERVAVAVAIGGVDYVVSKINSKEAKKNNTINSNKKNYSYNRYKSNYKK